MPSFYTNCDSACDSSGTVWGVWVTSNTASCTATADACWSVWTHCGTSATTTTTAAVWKVWTTNSGTSAGYYKSPAPAKPRELTADEKAERAAEAERRRVAAAARAEKEKAEREAADKRAEELLLAQLDAEQRADYARDKSFCVRSKRGQRYRIRRAWSGHVARLNDAGREVERLCIHPREHVPLPDNQLLSKLMLETDCEQFHRIANSTPIPVGAN